MISSDLTSAAGRSPQFGTLGFALTPFDVVAFSDKDSGFEEAAGETGSIRSRWPIAGAFRKSIPGRHDAGTLRPGAPILTGLNLFVTCQNMALFSDSGSRDIVA